jgi:hypothetical protein
MILVLADLATLVPMVHRPIAAALIELFPTRIRPFNAAPALIRDRSPYSRNPRRSVGNEVGQKAVVGIYLQQNQCRIYKIGGGVSAVTPKLSVRRRGLG